MRRLSDPSLRTTSASIWQPGRHLLRSLLPLWFLWSTSLPLSFAAEVRWLSWEPRVINPVTTPSAILTVTVDSDPADPIVDFKTNGCVPGPPVIDTVHLLPTAPGTYQATFSSAQLLHDYQAGDEHAVVGCLKESGFNFNLVVNIRTPAMPDVPVVPLGTDGQASILVNLRSETLLFGQPPADLLHRFYTQFRDDFHFVNVVTQVLSRNNRSYRALRNDTLGLGIPLFDNASAFGSPETLLGTIIFPIDSLFDLAESGAIHEMGHRWINSLGGIFDDPRDAHWPISSLAYGIMGISDSSGQGVSFPFSLVAQPGDTYLLSPAPPATQYNDLELYLMGLLAPEAVGQHIIFNDQDQLAQLIPGGTLAGPVATVSAADVVASEGPRIPAVGVAPSVFRSGSIVLSKSALLTPEEMAFFDHMAARGESHVELPFTSGLARGVTKPFFPATGGTGQLSTTVLDLINSAVDVFMIVDLSGSFADDLPLFQAQAPGVVSTLIGANPNTQFGLAKFEDYPVFPFGITDPARGDTAYERLVDLTLDPASVLDAIADLPVPLAGDGGDTPQSQLAALYQAATGAGQDLSGEGYPDASIAPGMGATFRPGATKIFLLWTDAPFHQSGDPGDIPYPGPTFDDTVAAIGALDPPKVIGISSGEEGRGDLERIARATGALAPTGGVDCDNDGTIDVAAGDPLVCVISPSGVGVGDAIVRLVEAAIEVDRPVARCATRTLSAEPGTCRASDVSIDAGSSDPSGGVIRIFQSPEGPYPVGVTEATLNVIDETLLVDSCFATVAVIDDQAPTPSCNAPAAISPRDAPISFTATASDNCAVASVRIPAYSCLKQGRKRLVNKIESCDVSISGDTITILDSGGVGNTIRWNVAVTDTNGLSVSTVCQVAVVGL